MERNFAHINSTFCTRKALGTAKCLWVWGTWIHLTSSPSSEWDEYSRSYRLSCSVPLSGGPLIVTCLVETGQLEPVLSDYFILQSCILQSCIKCPGFLQRKHFFASVPPPDLFLCAGRLGESEFALACSNCVCLDGGLDLLYCCCLCSSPNRFSSFLATTWYFTAPNTACNVKHALIVWQNQPLILSLSVSHAWNPEQLQFCCLGACKQLWSAFTALSKDSLSLWVSTDYTLAVHAPWDDQQVASASLQKSMHSIH